jgi:hypothetical protein
MVNSKTTSEGNLDMRLREFSNSEAAILSRIIKPKLGDLPQAAARVLQKFEIDESDRERMHELAVRNQEGELNDAEQHELESYRRVGRLLDLLAAKALLSLKKRGH